MWITTVDGSEIRRAPVDMVNACKCSNIYMLFVHPGWCRISEPSTVSVVLLHSPLENRSVFLGKLRKAEVFVHRTPQRRIEAKGTKRKFPWVSFPNRTPIQPGFLKYQGALYYQPKQCIVFFFGEIPQNYQRFLLFDSQKNGVPFNDPWILAAKKLELVLYSVHGNLDNVFGVGPQKKLPMIHVWPSKPSCSHCQD